MPEPSFSFAVFDGQEIVSYTPSGEPAVEGIRAVRRPLTKSSQRNVERFVELTATDIVLHLDALPLAEIELAVGDSLTDANSVVHEVLFAERQALSSSVAVVCRPT